MSNPPPDAVPPLSPDAAVARAVDAGPAAAPPVAIAEPVVAASADADAVRPAAFARSRSALLFIAVLLALFTCYLARDLIVPVLIAVFLALCGNPLVSRLNRWHVPRWAGSLAVVAGGLAAALLLTTTMLAPATEWLREAPSELRQHIPKLRELTKPLQEASEATESLQRMAEGPPAQRPQRVQVLEAQGSTMLSLLTNAPRTLGTVLAGTILWFFFMVYAEDLLRRFVTVVPGWRRKRVTVDILRAIQTDISRYVLTVSLINTALGIATAIALWGIGLSWDTALLWGAVAGLFNFAPYIGPMIAAGALCLVGLANFDSIAGALLPPGVFLFLHLIEGQIVTPLILGRRMAISPVILLLWLFLWGWMWGIAGLLLAVPMLVCFKIYCSRIDSLRSWALMMEP